METLPKSPVLIITEEDMQRTRRFYGVEDVKGINESLDAIEEWLKKQDHLVEASKHMSRNYLERLYILARGSIEMTKSKINKLLTSKFLMPEVCLNIKFQEFDGLIKCLGYVPLPKLSPLDHTRIIVTHFSGESLDEFTILGYFRLVFLVTEYMLNYEYVFNDRQIVDLKNINKLSFLAKLNPITIRKAEILFTEGYGFKIKGIHILNAPSFVDKLLFILKQALSAKVAGRIFVHNSYEDLHKHIPKEILPEDYEGDEVSLEQINEQWKEVLSSEEASKIAEESNKIFSDESKRTAYSSNEDYLGMPGSFRTLRVD